MITILGSIYKTLDKLSNDLDKSNPQASSHLYDALTCVDEAISAIKNFDYDQHLIDIKDDESLGNCELRGGE